MSCMFSCSKSEKVFLPGELWLDDNGVHINAHGGGILYQNGVYYWYGEHKTEGEGGNVANVGVHCYSSVNLYDWKDEGIALSIMPEGSGSDIEKGCILERPKVIYNERTNKYVMWFHLEPKGAGYTGARSGIAVADQPAGPFTFVRSVRPNAGSWPVNYPESF
ncbi:beta-glucanase, partial [Parabacteroides sp. OttesenSCG-928-G21]|nr:beta-glucanase [Parabacteroides sp. OttesenSCG-928-G21]